MDYIVNIPQEMPKTVDVFLGSMCVWREARSEPLTAKLAVAYVICNRAAKPGWWGHSVSEVVARRLQFSSMSQNGDPNLVDWPDYANPADPADWIAYQDALTAFLQAYTEQVSDPTQGCTYYFDKSMDNDPPTWSKMFHHICDLGRFHFYRN